mgnify:FL=1
MRDLVAAVEVDVYRGALFRLNEVLGALQRLADGGAATPEEIARLDTEKDALTQAARTALERVSADSADLIGDLARELED